MNIVELICGVCFKNTTNYIDFNAPFVYEESKFRFIETIDKNLTYLDCFHYCTKLNLEYQMDMPRVLCIECAKELEITYSFLVKAKQAEIMYKKALNKINLKEPILEEYEEDHVASNAESNNDVPDESEYLPIEKQDTIEKYNLGANSMHSESSDVSRLSPSDDNISDVELEDAESHQKDNLQSKNTLLEKLQPGSEGTDDDPNTKSLQEHFTCEICGKAYTKHNCYSAHLKYHERKRANKISEACQICYKQFVTPHYLHQHMAVHAKERKLHSCVQCNKMYYSKTALENHMRMHKGDTIVCNECGKQFARRYEFNVHMRFHKKDCPFACTMCDKKFTIKGHLREHMWRHQGLKLQCDECGKLFTSSKALNEHSFTHTTMPFQCLYCDRGYPSKQKYKVHLKSAHQIEYNEKEEQHLNITKPALPLQRRKLTLVQADNAFREIEIIAEDNSGEDFYEV